MPPLPPTKWIISFCHFNMELMRNKNNIQSDNIKTPTKQTDKQTYSPKDWGNKEAHHAPKIQPID